MKKTSFMLLCLFVFVVVGCNHEATTMESKSAGADGRYDRKAASVDEVRNVKVETPEFNTEEYDQIVENEFLLAINNPKSTFSIDVDTASYSNVRRFINDGKLPPKGAVRIEELINYFDYQYAGTDSEHPFSVQTDVSRCPWNEKHELARIAIRGKKIARSKKPDCNLVFLLDVSGSMNAPDKLPLLKTAMKMLVENLQEQDRLAIVVYAGASGVVLPSTPVSDKAAILAALDRLAAGGSTNGGQGIQLAYQIAAKNFKEDAVNRVLLCTDGDFNVGVTDRSSLVDFITTKAKSGIDLSVLGFGSGNLKDSRMESLADKGNGNYAYIDSELEAKKALVEQVDGTLITIAKDVKVQVDFNPAQVKAYRLIGYENRMLQNKDFADDKKDAGEIGAGHTVTALYELVPVGAGTEVVSDSESAFVNTEVKASAKESDVILNVDLRYKLPSSDESDLFSVALTRPSQGLNLPTGDFEFAASVAAYGMLLRDSEFKGDADWELVLKAAQNSLGEDQHGYRSEFVKLVRMASLID